MTATTTPLYGAPLPPGLTRDPAKEVRYPADVFLREALDQVRERAGDPVAFAARHGLLLLKPDAVVARRIPDALDWLAERRFRIVAVARVPLSPTAVRALWYFQWNRASAQRRWLADLFVPTVDALLLVVRAGGPSPVPVSVRLSELKGPTAPSRRRPGQLRHRLGGSSFLLNLVHTADEPADVLRELGVLLGHDERALVIDDAAAGHDRAARARRVAEDLHTAAPAHDLDPDASAARLRRAAGDLHPPSAAVRERLAGVLAVPGERGLAELAELARAERLDLPPWDLAVAGSAVLPMNEPGHPQVIEAMTPARWLAGPDTTAREG